MTRVLTLMALLVWATAGLAASEGMVRVKSAHDVATTADRLAGLVERKGLTLFARVDHAAGARGAGLALRPTELLIFGNPKVGTPLMQCRQEVALDLPQKALVWQDAEGQVWIGYNAPAYLAERHAIAGCDGVLEKIQGALAGLTGAAAAP